MSNWICSILFLINTKNDNLKRRKGKHFQLCFVIFLWGIIRMTFHCSVWKETWSCQTGNLAAMRFYAEMRKYVIFEFDFAWVPQQIYNYLISHCKEKRPKFNNKEIRFKKINILTFFSRLDSKLESRKQKNSRSLRRIYFSAKFKASWDRPENLVQIAWLEPMQNLILICPSMRNTWPSTPKSWRLASRKREGQIISCIIA